MSKFVYFAQRHSDQAIKIGYTSRVPERMAFLRLRFGDMTLLGLIPGTMSMERQLHKKFSSYRIQGEWFTPEAALLSYIKGNANGLPR